MKTVISYLFTSFFSHKQTKAFLERSLVLPLFSSFLLFIYIFIGTFFGYQLSFKNYYQQSLNYKDMLAEVFESGAEFHSNSDGLISSNLVISTLTNSSDKNRFEKYGFDVVVDTRDKATTYDDFEYYCVLNSDNSKRIEYDDYLLLNEEEKKSYSFVVNNRGVYLDTEENIDSYKNYIETKSEDLSSYNQLNDDYNNGKITKLDYSKKLYLMYAKLYFPTNLFSLDYYGELPTLRTYYMDHYKHNGVSNQYIYIFEEYAFSVFKSNGVRINYIGYYLSNKDYVFDAANSSALIDQFVMDMFDGGATQRVSNFMFSSFLCWFVSFVVLIILCFLMRLFSRSNHYENGLFFNNNFKIIGSFINVSSIITSLLCFGLSFLLARNIVFFVSVGSVITLIVIRTIVFYRKEFKISRNARINGANRFIPQ